jgi:hypothetical protein
VETDSHDTISIVKSFFNSISMMNIDVEIENAGIDFEKLKDAEDNVIDIAKATGLGLFTMMKASSPIYYYISLASYY